MNKQIQKKYLITLWLFPQKENDGSYFKLIVKNVEENDINIFKELIEQTNVANENPYHISSLDDEKKTQFFETMKKYGHNLTSFGENVLLDFGEIYEYESKTELEDILVSIAKDLDDY